MSGMAQTRYRYRHRSVINARARAARVAANLAGDLFDADAIAQRFWSKVETGPILPGMDTPCWIWTASLTSSGYGQFILNGTPRSASRIAWILTNGPTQLHVLHRCDNPPCVNVAHLFEGTNLDNIIDRMAKGRSRGGAPQGEAHPRARLNDTLVREIRAAYAAGGETHDTIALRFRLPRGTTSGVLSGRNWRHVE